MIKKLKDGKKIFSVFCADWECSVHAEDIYDAYCMALSECFEKYGKNSNLSPTIGVIDVSESYSELKDPDNISFVYTPKALADAGMHDLSKKFENVLNLKNKWF